MRTALLIVSLFFCSKVVFGANTTLKYPSATGAIYNTWTDPDNAYAADGSRASLLYSAMPGSQDYSIYNIPDLTGQTPVGIEINGSVYHNNSSGYTHVGVEISSNHGATWTSTGYYFETSSSWSEETFTIGGPTTLWGRTWTSSDFTNANFMVRFTFTNAGITWRSEMDYNAIRVYYTPIVISKKKVLNRLLTYNYSFYQESTTTPPPPPPDGDIWDINQMIGRGMNAYGIADASWDDKYFDSIAALGFNSVRLVSFEPINTSGMTAVKSMVDKALAAGLLPIFCHWGPAFLSNPTQGNFDQFVADWNFISSFFANYTNTQLILELVNEPEGATADQWNIIVSRCVAAIRNNDADRAIMISPIYWAGVKGLASLVLPVDDYLIVSVHYYQPETFSWQGANVYRGSEWVGEHWYPIQPFIDNVDAWFAPAIAFQTANNVPINVGEFGSFNLAPVADRARHMNYHARYFASLGWSWDLWDFYRDYGIYDPVTDLTNPYLRNALLRDPMPSVMSYSASTIYQSNFASTDGWGASTGVTVSASGGVLLGTVSSAGTTLDRYVYRSFSLVKGKIYRITYTIRSNPTRGWSVYTFGAYLYTDIINLTTSGQTTTYSWAYSYNSDANAVFRFNIGGSTANFYVSNFKLEELTVP
jgi:endoglucanase